MNDSVRRGVGDAARTATAESKRDGSKLPDSNEAIDAEEDFRRFRRDSRTMAPSKTADAKVGVGRKKSGAKTAPPTASDVKAEWPPSVSTADAGVRRCAPKQDLLEEKDDRVREDEEGQVDDDAAARTPRREDHSRDQAHAQRGRLPSSSRHGPVLPDETDYTGVAYAHWRDPTWDDAPSSMHPPRARPPQPTATSGSGDPDRDRVLALHDQELTVGEAETLLEMTRSEFALMRRACAQNEVDFWHVHGTPIIVEPPDTRASVEMLFWTWVSKTKRVNIDYVRTARTTSNISRVRDMRFRFAYLYWRRQIHADIASCEAVMKSGPSRRRRSRSRSRSRSSSRSRAHCANADSPDYRAAKRARGPDSPRSSGRSAPTCSHSLDTPAISREAESDPDDDAGRRSPPLDSGYSPDDRQQEGEPESGEQARDDQTDLVQRLDDLEHQLDDDSREHLAHWRSLRADLDEVQSQVDPAPSDSRVRGLERQFADFRGLLAHQDAEHRLVAIEQHLRDHPSVRAHQELVQQMHDLASADSDRRLARLERLVDGLLVFQSAAAAQVVRNVRPVSTTQFGGGPRHSAASTYFPEPDPATQPGRFEYRAPAYLPPPEPEDSERPETPPAPDDTA